MTEEWPLSPTSSSAVDSYDLCPLQWGVRYGPQRELRRGHGQPTDSLDVSRRRGRVVHEGVCTALRCAERELAELGTPIPGTLRRYYKPARVALGQAWLAEKMPSDPAEGQLVTDLFERTLDAVTIPRPGSIYGIEARYEHTTPSGVKIVFGPDFSYWVRPGVLRIVDWKSGKIDPADVPRHPQLLRYAVWMAQRDPSIRDIEIELFAMRDGVGHVAPVDPARAAKAAARFDRIAWQAATDPEPQANVGPHCNGCRFRLVCPALRARMGATDAA